MNRKVLFTASTYSHIVHFHLPYLQAFKDNGWIVHVACGGTTDFIACADKIMHVPFQKKMTSPKNFGAAAKLRFTLEQEQYDLICTHTSLAAFFTRLAVVGMKNRPQLVNVVHGYLFDDQTDFLKRTILLLAERMTAKQTDLLLTMNQWDYENAQRYNLGNRITMIPGIGVDFSRFDRNIAPETAPLRATLGIPEGHFVLIYAAEFSKRKSQATLIQAMPLLPDHVSLILAGDGATRKKCEKIAQNIGVADRVYFPGYIKDVPLFYNEINAVVSSSRSEGLPFNVMEALHLGVPVIASAVKGHTDLITHGQTGLLFPYGDHCAYAEAVTLLLSDANFAHAIACNGKRSVSRYSLDRVKPIVMSCYEGVFTCNNLINSP